jgi:hypothetical protein
MYTREEAEAMLPVLRERLARIRTNRQVLLRAAQRIDGQVASDGGGHFGSDYWTAARALKADVEWFAAENILLRDPETGLLDFPSIHEGREVYLCWRLAEDRIEHWHDVDAGFLGRRPL